MDKFYNNDLIKKVYHRKKRVRLFILCGIMSEEERKVSKEKKENILNNADTKLKEKPDKKNKRKKRKEKKARRKAYEEFIKSFSNEEYKGSIKSMYMRFMLAVLFALLTSTLITTVLVYGLRSAELSRYINDRMRGDFEIVGVFIERFNASLPDEKDHLTVDEIESLFKDFLGNEYTVEVYNSYSEMVNSLKSLFNEEDLAQVMTEHIVLFKNGWFDNIGVARIEDCFVMLKTSQTGSSDIKQIWFNVIWTTGFFTIFVALIINSLTIKTVIKPIKAVSDAMQQVTRGNFDIQLEVVGNDENSVLQRNFNTMTDGLKQNEEMSKNFASIVSHEYKTPIAAITGYAQLLYNGGLEEEEEKQYIKTILEQSKRLSNLSVNMLQLARLDSNTVGMSKEMFSLDEQIRNVIVNMENLWEQKNIEMDINLDKAQVYCNSQMLYHVWENLLSNAIKFTPENGKITVTCQVSDNYAVVKVADTGCGISPENIPHIFERFYKSDSEVNADGNGLGLAITQKIIQLSGGKVSVESEAGKGSLFTVTLPAFDYNAEK